MLIFNFNYISYTDFRMHLNLVSYIEIITDDLNTQRIYNCTSLLLSPLFRVYVTVWLLDVDVILIFHVFDCEEARLT